MTPETFKHHKDQVLQGVDLSRKGCVDEPIKQLVEFINGLEDFVTTSSCSGRAILFCEGGSNKKGCRWLYTSHGAAEEGTLVASANPAHGSLVLKYEPLILHVQCLSVERAKTMHTCALDSGFRNSGITIGKNGKVTLAVRSCIGLEAPLSEDGQLMVTEEYLKFLTRKVNEKVKENTIRSERFFHNLKRVFNGTVCDILT
ncbi:tRNA wybutosine-synthesizing protein 3 homolog isoform X1 [Bacillus rossius redtenbacheri]|uniref:tRNA wybutosine-synthesizing protein 3 homolog isoform X1 n=1 Tax=Bacillus rossius redtenbacheri TaxID=93214 RepID=UPI002FDCCB92